MEAWENTTLVLPCAGLGTRVGADVSSGKELMKDAAYDGPLIDWIILNGVKAGFKINVIVRADKTKLIEYLKTEFDGNLLTITIIAEAGQEWPDTILKSAPLWTAYNIMALPDTRFPNPVEVFKEIRSGLVRQPIQLATFDIKARDSHKFAVRSNNQLCEKPIRSAATTAIGLIGFRKSAGVHLFEGLSKREFFTEPHIGANIHLDWFKDITRNGTIEGDWNEGNED